MADINEFNNSNPMQTLLMADDIKVGDVVSYQTCKTIYLYHPLGMKMVDSPVTVALSQERKINIPNSPEELVADAFKREWERLGCNELIKKVMRIKRIYGVASIIYGGIINGEAIDTEQYIDPQTLADMDIYFNVLDPLNTSGSIVLNQDPNSPDFQKPSSIAVAGKAYHRSRSLVVFNEEPIYIEYTQSAYGFSGRSIYQRSLFPLKSFIQSMITDDMVIVKSGVIISKQKPAGSIIDRAMDAMARIKRKMIKDAKQNNVLSMHIEESIETLNMQNIDKAIGVARTNIIENIASSCDMPPKLLLADSYASLMANGTEDFKQTIMYIESLQLEMKPIFTWLDRIVMIRAWSKSFYTTIQAQFPEYAGVSHEQAFSQWSHDFNAEFPSLHENEDKRMDKERVKLDSIKGILDTLLPQLDPENKATLIDWAASNLNANKTMFTNPLNLDIDALMTYEPQQQMIQGDSNESQI